MNKKRQIDRHDTRTKMIGDLDYTRALTKDYISSEKSSIAKEIALKEPSRKINSTVDQLLTPKGMDEKRRRRFVIPVLQNAY